MNYINYAQEGRSILPFLSDFHHCFLLQAYSMVLVLFVTRLFSFGLSHCLLTYLAKWAIFLWLSWLRAISEATYICFLGLCIFLSTCSYPILGHKRTKSTLIQWNLDLTNLYKMKSLIKQMIFFTPVIVKCIPKKNLDITKPLYSEQILPIPWAFVKLRFHSTWNLYNTEIIFLWWIQWFFLNSKNH